MLDNLPRATRHISSHAAGSSCSPQLIADDAGVSRICVATVACLGPVKREAFCKTTGSKLYRCYCRGSLSGPDPLRARLGCSRPGWLARAAPDFDRYCSNRGRPVECGLGPRPRAVDCRARLGLALRTEVTRSNQRAEFHYLSNPCSNLKLRTGRGRLARTNA